MSKMRLSIIIPTYNRPNELSEVLSSIEHQSLKPEEVIVVDDSEDEGAKKLCRIKKQIFTYFNCNLVYIKNNRVRSSAVARNVGFENSSGDIVLFLDDDVILHKEYLSEILKVYSTKNDALGVQGFIMNVKIHKDINIDLIHKISNIGRKIFLLHNHEAIGCRILPNFSLTYPSQVPNHIIKSERLHGCNMSFKKDVFSKELFDENLLKYSFLEDADVSYRINKYSGNLYLNPNARLIHKEPKNPNISRERVIMEQVYPLYLFYKNINTFKGKLMFLWSRIGFILLYIPLSIIRPNRMKSLRYLIEAYVMCLRHLKEIKSGDLEFFNKKLRV